MNSFWEDLQHVRLHRRVARIESQISALGEERKKNKRKALRLTHQRERLMGQELTVAPHIS